MKIKIIFAVCAVAIFFAGCSFEKQTPNNTAEIEKPQSSTISTEDSIEKAEDEPIFTLAHIPIEVKELMLMHSNKEEAYPFINLRYLKISYLNFNGETMVGDMVVNKAIAEKTLDIFKYLYKEKYPIEKISLIDHYKADDNLSMEDNNTTAFCYRMVAGTNTLSNHAMGLAIDINPKINPYVYKYSSGKLEIAPKNGEDFIDRTKEEVGMILKDDICYQAFIDAGFSWGGDWKNPKDYQHFEYAL